MSRDDTGCFIIDTAFSAVVDDNMALGHHSSNCKCQEHTVHETHYQSPLSVCMRHDLQDIDEGQNIVLRNP